MTSERPSQLLELCASAMQALFEKEPFKRCSCGHKYDEPPCDAVVVAEGIRFECWGCGEPLFVENFKKESA